MTLGTPQRMKIPDSQILTPDPYLLRSVLVADLLTLSPIEFKHIGNCSLQHHFWQQSNVDDGEDELLSQVVLQTIQHLHAVGGPNRLNLPGLLRYVQQAIPLEYQSDIGLNTMARQVVANYHRRLRQEWAKLIASTELLSLNIKLRRTIVRCQAVIDRLDKEEDGGITVIKFITHPASPPNSLTESDLEATMLHALAAAAYPQKRPVRVKYLWLIHNQSQTIELPEKPYRHNLEKIKEAVRKWLAGEILAHPGLHCDQCAFKYTGCPLYLNESPTDSEEPLQSPPLSDTISMLDISNASDTKDSNASSDSKNSREWIFMEDNDFNDTETKS